MADPTRGFVNDGSTGVENWRGIVLFGRNVARVRNSSMNLMTLPLWVFSAM